jgi:hypothetical protein
MNASGEGQMSPHRTQRPRVSHRTKRRTASALCINDLDRAANALRPEYLIQIAPLIDAPVGDDRADRRQVGILVYSAAVGDVAGCDADDEHLDGVRGGLWSWVA